MNVLTPHSAPRRAKAAAVIVAAGSSKRMGRGVRKPFLELAGRPILEHACAAFDAAPSVTELVLVVHADDLEEVQRLVAERPAFAKCKAEVAGGAERADSVRIGVLWTSFDVDVICVHDAARALIEPEVVERAIEAAARDGASLVAVPVRDTIKASSDGARAESTVDRERLWSAQTPQSIAAETFRELVKRAEQEGWRPTDDAALYERYVGAVPIVEGASSNLKITTQEDLVVAEAILGSRAARREATA